MVSYSAPSITYIPVHALRLLSFATVLGVLLGTSVAGRAQIPSERLPDGLLSRPDLQHAVDLQVQRDGRALAALLSDSDPAVRARAAYALGSVQDPAAEAALLRLLRDESAQVRMDAAFALGQLPSLTSSDGLLDALASETDPAVRAELISALGKTGDERSLRRLIGMPLGYTDRAVAALAIGRYGIRDIHAPEAVAWLLSLLSAPDASVRLSAAYYFGRSRMTEPWDGQADSVRAALDRLQPDDPAAMHLISGLGRLGLPEDVHRLAHWLTQGRDWRTRVNAARALGNIAEDPQARSELLAALDDSVHHVVLVAAEALSNAPFWSPATSTRVRAWLQSHPETHPAATALLRGLARHTQDEAFALERIQRLQATSSTRYPDNLPALAELPGEASFTWLSEAVTGSNKRVAYAALDALGARWRRERGTTEMAAQYFPLFANALRTRDLALAYTAAPLLADSLFLPLGSIDVLAEVYSQLQTPEDIEPMTAILGALGATGNASARPILEEALQHPNPVVRRAAAQALGMEDSPDDQAVEPPQRTVDWAYLRSMGPHPSIVLNTEKGTVVMRLYTEQAPLTVQTLLQLTEQGRFDGVPFHRVVPNFVVQGGDVERQDGFGGPGFAIRSEFTRTPFVRGSVGMASAGKDTEGSQFFVAHSMQPHLDGRYTAFGDISEGMDVIDRLAKDDRILQARAIPSEGAGY